MFILLLYCLQHTQYDNPNHIPGSIFPPFCKIRWCLRAWMSSQSLCLSLIFSSCLNSFPNSGSTHPVFDFSQRTLCSPSYSCLSSSVLPGYSVILLETTQCAFLCDDGGQMWFFQWVLFCLLTYVFFRLQSLVWNKINQDIHFSSFILKWVFINLKFVNYTKFLNPFIENHRIF